ncbi:ABC transporter ATP-binding protein [Aliterella atlantica]|uniref:Mannose-1-phosphate guanyltransferase n=1 Tax=Aliterella atlantica CENA595 TaxID=1618023 RepID=A0A0D8ZQ73_9CYAN|nr:ABC transporter ATP-binding protein [Aliterella atlantica]KJH70497.1 mannose-1-phosphate guanyltransferase [Aliterella atlantica CENA595]
MSDVLKVRNLKVEFFTDEKIITAVDDISFELERGKTLGIVGESGSGKSVTSLALMGLLPSSAKISGEVLFRCAETQPEVDLLQLSSKQMLQYRGGKIAMVFQEPMSALNPVYTCGFQLEEAILRHQKVSQKEARRIAISLLQEVKLLPSDEELQKQFLASPRGSQSHRLASFISQQKQAILDRYPHELSGGQLQRVTIAMAISCNPTLLIADEPTTALDVTVQATIIELLKELSKNRQMSMIFITHDLGLVAEVAESVAVMYQGKIVEYGAINDVFKQPQHPYTKGLLACRPTLEKRSQYLLTVADYMSVKVTTNGKLEILPEDPKLPPEVSTEALQQRLNQLTRQQPLLDVSNLQVGFPNRGAFGQTRSYVMAVNGVSFQVYPGETLGLVGESGCGKTTLGRTLLRLITPISGSVMVEGQNVAVLRGVPLQKLRQEMQIIFQNPFSSLDPRMKIGDAIIEPLVIHSTKNKDRQRRTIAGELLERVGLNPSLTNRYPHEFSGGQRQRICIARALALRPKFIICDESVSSLDVSVQAQVLNLLKELQAEYKLTYIFISHDLNVVKFMSDRILVMNQGKIVEQGAAESIYRNPQNEYTRRLIDSIPKGLIEV